jgi:LysM repeat protein
MILAAFGFVSVPAASADSSCGATYIVQAGDYLSLIARKCGVSFSALVQANPQISNLSRIFPGQVINIPTGATPVGSYTVQQGDTLSSIAQKFNVTTQTLRTINPQIGSQVSAGQQIVIPQRISFSTGATASVITGDLSANSTRYFVFSAMASQVFELNLSPNAQVTLTVQGANGTVVKSGITGGSVFRGTLPTSQEYILILKSGSQSTSFNINLAIPARISFAPGGTSATVKGTIPVNLTQYYILKAQASQTMQVSVTPQNLRMSIYGVDGTVLSSGMGQVAAFNGTLPVSQDYIIALSAQAGQSASFSMTVTIPATPIPGTGSSNVGYTVKSGDTLSAIARTFGTTVTILLRANPQITNANLLVPGQVVYLPGNLITTSTGQKIYIVKPGDTLSAIAATFGTTLSKLLQANTQITNTSLIFPGQRIVIP